MQDLIASLKKALIDSAYSYTNLITGIKTEQATLENLELAKSDCLLRLSAALDGCYTGAAGTADILVLLRQVMRTYSTELTVSEQFWHRLKKLASDFAIYPAAASTTNSTVLKAETWRSQWLNNSNLLDLLEMRRTDPTVIGDGLLYAMNASTTYQSEAQKAAVQTSILAAPASTTLITLPTGAGKSMCILLPAWQSSLGGTAKAGTTLVVVPTVALALDQLSRARQYFNKCKSAEYAPQALLGETPEEEKNFIYKSLEKGTLPILYTSPESLLNSKLYNVCLKVAEKGYLNRLVIDEAHLVETWGKGFRTEFQLLSAYQKKLLEASKNCLRTLLLSATVSQECDKLLEELFSTNSNFYRFYRVQANRLRPEPGYWFSYTRSEDERQQRLLEALCYLPRPLILYVTRPHQANQWLQLLKEHEYRRVAAFTGETPSSERNRILEEWHSNKLDIIVATSAFGLGVDKNNVRAVLHACLPENPDRFYQEIGRGGRDGCSSVSLTCITQDDSKLAFEMTTRSLITPETAYRRWQSMWQTAKGGGIAWEVNINTGPPEHQNATNRQWNEHLLLLMHRAKLICILDNRDAELEYQPAKSSFFQNVPVYLPIKLLEPDIVKNETDFLTRFSPVREKEADQVKKTLENMRELVKNFSKPTPTERCIAYSFADLYPDCALACGGCPTCRAEQQPAYFESLAVTVQTATTLEATTFLRGELAKRMTNRSRRKTFNLFWEEQRTLADIPGLETFLVNLVRSGIQQIVLPDELLEIPQLTHNLVQKLRYHYQVPHFIFSQEWLQSKQDLPFYSLPTALFYPTNEAAADQFHRAFQRNYAHLFEATPLFNIVRRSLYLENENGLFIDRVNGIVERLAEWQLLLQLT